MPTLVAGEDWIFGATFDPTGKWLASVSKDGTWSLWSVSQDNPIRTLRASRGILRTVAYSPSGALIATGGRDGVVRLWSPKGDRVGALDAKITGDGRWIFCVQFGPQGKTLAVGHRNGSILLWRVPSGERLRTIAAHTNFVRSIAFTPDGRRLVSGGDDKKVRVFDVASGRPLRVLGGSEWDIRGVAVHPDGRTVAAASWQSVLLWDLTSGRQLLRDTHPGGWTWSVAFRRDGKMLAAGGGRRDPRIWLWRRE